MRSLSLLFILLFSLSFLGQKIDSLIAIYENEEVDTAKVFALIEVGWQYMDEGVSDSCLLYFDKAIDLSKKIDYKNGLLASFNAKANGHMRNNELEEAKEIFESSLKIEGLADQQIIVFTSNLGMLYAYLGDNTTALMHYENVLNLLTDDPKNDYNKSIIFGSIAKINRILKNPEKALEYDSLAMELKVKTNNKVGIAVSYTNLATDYQQLGDLEKALFNYRKSLSMSIETDSKLDQALANYNIGALYKSLVIDTLTQFLTQPYEGIKANFMDSAYVYYFDAYELVKDSDYELYKDDLLMGLLEVITYKGDYDQAIPLYQDIYDRNEKKLNTMDRAAFGLYEAHKEAENYEKALLWHEEHSRIQDSLFVDAKEQRVLEITEKYENDNIKKDAELIELKRKEEEAAYQLKLESEKAWNLTYLIALTAVILILIIGYYLFRQLKKTKENLQQKNREVSDSINVAKNIQNALLPSISNFNLVGIESFVLYKPKDIVSGDFYFHHRIKDITYVAAADCTGHGIPGSMLSFLAISLLDKVVTDQHGKNIDHLLLQLNEELNQKLKSQSNIGSIKAGLDITLCAYNHNTQQLEFAGTHNPLYLVRQGVLTQYKGDKVNIGNNSEIKSNSLKINTINIQSGDSIYLMSDGFCDQKGGPNNKKFYYPPFRTLLTENAGLPMNRQHEILDKTLIEWMGKTEQIDDILILGVKF